MFSNSLFCRRCIKTVLSAMQKVSRQRSTMASLRRISVRNIEGEDQLMMKFTYENDAVYKGLTFSRLKDEDLGTTTERISSNVSKFVNKKLTVQINKLRRAGRLGEAAQLEEGLVEIPVRVSHDGATVDTSQCNQTTWIEGAEVLIGDVTFTVELNVPDVISLKVPRVLIAGFPCYPRVNGEFVDLDRTEFTWYKENSAQRQPKKKSAKARRTQQIKNEEEAKMNGAVVEKGHGTEDAAAEAGKGAGKEEWERVHTGHLYTPNNSDIGKKLKLVCIPKNGTQVGDAVEYITKEVQAGTGLCPFETRHEFTSSLTPPGQFRVVCYNILADVYADSDFARTKLFPYCPNYALDFDYRKLLIVKELIGYNADIICLQECDNRMFTYDLTFMLERQGMSGAFLQKYGSATEGCATFYRRDKFRLIDKTELNITKALMSDPAHADTWQKVSTNTELKDYVTDRTTCCQTVLLESLESPSERVLVATTHLFFHPKANLIRILQTSVILKQIEKLLEKYTSQGPRPSVVFCGDLNSCPTSSVVEYITTRTLAQDCPDYFDEDHVRRIPSLDLSHGLTLTSACGLPEFTNFPVGFVETIDYVFIESDRLETAQVVPPPSRAVLEQFTALPSVVMPSDHLAQVCDIKFKNVKDKKDAEDTNGYIPPDAPKFFFCRNDTIWY